MSLSMYRFDLHELAMDPVTWLCTLNFLREDKCFWTFVTAEIKDWTSMQVRHEGTRGYISKCYQSTTEDLHTWEVTWKASAVDSGYSSIKWDRKNYPIIQYIWFRESFVWEIYDDISRPLLVSQHRGETEQQNTLFLWRCGY